MVLSMCRFLVALVYCALIAFVVAETPSLTKISDHAGDFQFGEKYTKYAIYRLIGNDMPPLQMTGQLRWNTEYALRHEPHLPGVQKKWILNRIWNETELELLYSALLRGGVNRRDIIVRCFDLDVFAQFKTKDDQLFYLTAQNDARNAGIIDGKENGFEWSIILDGNTFISLDSWQAMKKGLDQASRERKQYFKIPYHRVHSEQNSSWLNRAATMNTIMAYAPTKGESQMAFHKDSKVMFTLGDTNSDAKDPKKKRGYGQRNKSYLFKDGQLCGPDSKVCACADVFEGNEEDLKGVKLSTSYASSCGLVLRLWNYPTDNVIFTGLSSKDEEGFFYFLNKKRDSIEHVYTECALFTAAIELWKGLDEKNRQKYRTNKALAKQYKDNYHNIFLTQSCFRSRDREIAQNITYDGINGLLKKYGIRSRVDRKRDDSKTAFSASAASTSSYNSFCKTNYHRKSIAESSATIASSNHYLTVFDEETMKHELSNFNTKGSYLYDQIAPYLLQLMDHAERSMKYQPLSVVNKKRLPFGINNRRLYFSNRPFHWHADDLTPLLQEKLRNKDLQYDERNTVHVENQINPCYFIGSVGDAYYDKASLYYTITNTTTLALAWYFHRNVKYAQYAVQLIDIYFLSNSTGMLPNLNYAEDGAPEGVLDLKDFYYFTDALTLLERSGFLANDKVRKMRRWCGRLLNWLMQSSQGHAVGHSINNRGVAFDLLTLSLATYAQEESEIDFARSRLAFRLSRAAPLGHFALDGSQPHEVIHNSPLHFLVFNMVTWMHAATMVESIRINSRPVGSSLGSTVEDGIISLWDIRHSASTTGSSGNSKNKNGNNNGDNKDDSPVLLKATRWLLQYLPTQAKYFATEFVPEKNDFPKMSKAFPFHQKRNFQFDRMLEIVHYAVQIYGPDKVFDTDHVNDDVRNLFSDTDLVPLYTINLSTQNNWANSVYESGTRLWPALGLPQSRLGLNKSVGVLSTIALFNAKRQGTKFD